MLPDGPMLGAVGRGLSDRRAAGMEVETDGRLGMVGILRPAGDAGFADGVDIAAQLAGARCVGRAKQPGALRNGPPHRLDFIAIIESRRTIARRSPDLVGVDRVVFMLILQHPAAVVLDPTLPPRAF